MSTFATQKGRRVAAVGPRGAKAADKDDGCVRWDFPCDSRRRFLVGKILLVWIPFSLLTQKRTGISHRGSCTSCTIHVKLQQDPDTASLDIGGICPNILLISDNNRDVYGLYSMPTTGDKLTSWRRLRVFRAATAKKSTQPPPGGLFIPCTHALHSGFLQRWFHPLCSVLQDTSKRTLSRLLDTTAPPPPI